MNRDFCVSGKFEVSPSIVNDIYLFCCSPTVILYCVFAKKEISFYRREIKEKENPFKIN